MAARPTRKRKNVDYGDMMDSGDENDEKPFDEDLVFVKRRAPERIETRCKRPQKIPRRAASSSTT